MKHTIIKKWKQLWNLAKTVKKATLKKSKTTLGKNLLLNSKTGFSLPAPQFCFRNFVWCFWKALKGKKKGDFVFCKVWMINMFPYHVFRRCLSQQTPSQQGRCGWKVSAGIVVATKADAAIPFGLLEACILRTVVLLITTRSHSFLTNCFLWQITTQIHKGTFHDIQDLFTMVENLQKSLTFQFGKLSKIEIFLYFFLC